MCALLVLKQNNKSQKTKAVLYWFLNDHGSTSNIYIKIIVETAARVKDWMCEIKVHGSRGRVNILTLSDGNNPGSVTRG